MRGKTCFDHEVSLSLAGWMRAGGGGVYSALTPESPACDE